VSIANGRLSQDCSRLPLEESMTTASRRSPRLSIGMPVYNGERFLAQALDSLLAQTFRDFEIVISDNASTDQTPEICRDYAGRDSRVRYIRNERNLGALPNHNKVFSLCRGSLIKWAAHDDLHEASFLEKCVKILDENSDVAVAHSGSLYVDATKQPFLFDADRKLYLDPRTGAQLTVDPASMAESPFSIVRFADVLFNSDHSHQMYGVFRRDVLEQTRLFQVDLAEGDKALLLQVALLGRFAQVRENLFIKRFHKSMSAALPKEELQVYISAARSKYPWHLRKILGFINSPIGLPINWATKLCCFAIVVIYGLKMLPIVLLRRTGVLHTPDEMTLAALGNPKS
jgi:glycosyltransferase involved in cell wall biosynthesis